MVKPSRQPPPVQVRTRRAYFDCKFGQLHVRTAFPTTGGFDEQVTLFCLHSNASSSRAFAKFLPAVADVRSVYAPDLPGCGESDSAPVESTATAAEAVSDLATDLRLRQIDVMGIAAGATVAVALAAARPELVRRLILLNVSAEALPTVKQRALILRGPDDSATALLKARAALPNGQIEEAPGTGADWFDSATEVWAKKIGGFLSHA